MSDWYEDYWDRHLARHKPKPPADNVFDLIAYNASQKLDEAHEDITSAIKQVCSDIDDYYRTTSSANRIGIENAQNRHEEWNKDDTSK